VEDPLIERLIDRLHFAAGHEAPDGSSTMPEGRGTFGHFVRVARDFTPRVTETERQGKGPRKMALVGPTGVGKTTTIAKIASHCALRESQRVALATLDTYRIAAADQLRTYARLLGVPIEVLSEPSQLGACFDRFADMDLVLVDTPGHSPRDDKAVARLAADLGKHPDVEVHLVLNCSTRGNELRRVMESFRPMGYNRLIFSKLDEADCWGELLNTWIMGGFEVSYFTTGQRVPEDLEPASVEFLCRGLIRAL
jgi:flagellar biosynthesis protein FlhF